MIIKMVWQWTHPGANPWAAVKMRIDLRHGRGTAWLRCDVHHGSCPTGQQHY
jgi:hypothetical protein